MRRTARRLEWSELELRKELGGFRHYLDDKPIHCGDQLELQDRAEAYDDDDRPYTVPQSVGHFVRYEARQVRRAGADAIAASLFLHAGGTTYMVELSESFRFRWPAF